MKTALLIVLITALHSFGSHIFSKDVTEPQKLRYKYLVETELSTEKFSDAFCDRLSAKHKWNKVSTNVSAETYTRVFKFEDDSSHPWQCEVQIKRVKNDLRKMSVEMIMSPILES